MSEEYESPYCEVCGTCGYIGCCGIRNFIEEHIKGKTNCKNEDLIISELIYLCENEEDKDKEIEILNEIMQDIIKDLKDTIRLNKHYLDGNGNEYINIDIDHLRYLIQSLEYKEHLDYSKELKENTNGNNDNNSNTNNNWNTIANNDR